MWYYRSKSNWWYRISIQILFIYSLKNHIKITTGSCYILHVHISKQSENVELDYFVCEDQKISLIWLWIYKVFIKMKNWYWSTNYRTVKHLNRCFNRWFHFLEVNTKMAPHYYIKQWQTQTRKHKSYRYVKNPWLYVNSLIILQHLRLICLYKFCVFSNYPINK